MPIRSFKPTVESINECVYESSVRLDWRRILCASSPKACVFTNCVTEVSSRSFLADCRGPVIDFSNELRFVLTLRLSETPLFQKWIIELELIAIDCNWGQHSCFHRQNQKPEHLNSLKFRYG